jgi:hypothetical protein
VRGAESVGEGRLEHVERRLHDVEDALAVDAGREAALERRGRARPREREADGPVVAATPPVDQRGEQARVVETARLRRRAVDLVEVEPRPRRSRLSASWLVKRGSESSFSSWTAASTRQSGGVAVPPFAADRERLARTPSLGEPAREELLGAAVAPRDVDVTDAGLASGVEDLARPRVQRVRRAVGRQVARPAERDVARSPDSPRGRRRGA